MFYFSRVHAPGPQMSYPTCQDPCFRTHLFVKAAWISLLPSDLTHFTWPCLTLAPFLSLSVQCANCSVLPRPSHVPHAAWNKGEDVTNCHSAVIVLTARKSHWYLSLGFSSSNSRAAWVVFTGIPARSFQCCSHESFFVIPLSHDFLHVTTRKTLLLYSWGRELVFMVIWQDQGLCKFLLYH